MSIFDGLFDRVGKIFNGGIDEILFFVLAFIILFNSGGLFERDDRSDENGTEYILFFIVLFIMLLAGDREEKID